MNFKKTFYVLAFLILATIVFAAKEEPETVKLILRPVILYGVVLGLYELFLIHADENFRGSHWIGHGIQAVGFMIVAIFAIMNVEFVTNWLSNYSIPSFLKNPHVFRLVIGVILNIKIHSTSAVFQTSGLTTKAPAEHWTHTTLVSALCVLTAYLHPYLAGLLPVWLQ